MQSKSNFLTLPGAIIIAGALVAIAIIWTSKPASVPDAASVAAAAASGANVMAPITAADHILGNPNAPVKLIEYSDPSCPYCKMFNPTMEEIMSDYGPSGNVVWIYRQFPLNQPDQNGDILHPLAGTQAEAFECAASLGGNTVFWKYEEEWFNDFPQDGADEEPSVDNQQIAATAKDVGLDPVAFNDCVTSNQFKDKINSEYMDGLNVGVSGTPTTILIAPDGTRIPLTGVQSYDTLKSTIDTLLGAETDSAASTTSDGQ